MLGWEGVTGILEEATGEQADHFKERSNIYPPFRTSVTKSKSEIRQNTEDTRVMERLASSLK